MLLRAQIAEDMKTAMRAKDAPRLSAIRLLLAALKQREVDERIELTDADVLAIIEKMVKQRRDEGRKAPLPSRRIDAAAQPSGINTSSAAASGCAGACSGA